MDRREFLIGSAAIAAVATPLSALAVGRKPSKLRVALLPDENASTIIQNAQPLKTYLEAALKKDVELVVTTDYSSMIEAARFGRIEIAYFGPLSYVLAKSKAPKLEPFAVGLSKGSPTYKSVLIANPETGVKSAQDVKGKIMGFGDQASTSSHLIPRAMLAKAGLKAVSDYKAVYLGAHDAVARAVQSGKVQAGGMSQAIYNRLVSGKKIDPKKVAVLQESAPIPNYPIVMQGDLDEALKGRIRTAFLDMKDKAILKSFRAQGFVKTNDHAYDILRETAKLLNLDLAKVGG
ncbi:MAG: phosphate/phosphite/phosphonate ABC transporter substrate-binding protein [Hyphomicrobiales bacterium]|nr:phosphate/phosphite/phosphonate ABC transporter substrate-binding protein [Hyphomicrobiales bacterium]